MKYNDLLSSSYGTFAEMQGASPVRSKPSPLDKDYKAGNFIRAFAKKINEELIIEIDGEAAKKINSSLYQVVFVSWSISGPKENKRVDGTLIPGVYNQNLFEIERVQKENGMDLKKVLTNPLEYWRGY